MKNLSVLMVLAFLSLTLVGCSEKKATSGSSQNTLCDGTNYYTSPSCPGYGSVVPGTTAGAAGGVTGGATSCTQNPFSYDCYCKTIPTAYGCPSQSPKVDYDWGQKYPGRSKALTAETTCSTSSTSGLHPTRKAIATINSGTWYNPSDIAASNYTNTTSFLKNVSGAKTFLLTDSALKVRFKPLAEPESAKTTYEQSCYGRTDGQPWLPGYTKLKFRVKVIGTKSDNTTEEEYLGQFTAQIGSCSTVLDLSTYSSYYSNGMYLVVYDVHGNKGDPGPSNYWQDGFIDSNSFQGASSQRSSECWSMEIEVAADGTQTFN